MTQEQFNAMMQTYLNQINALSEDSWSQTEGGWAAACGAVSPVNGNKIFDGTAPQGLLTREMCAAVLYRLGLVKEEGK